MGERPSLAWAQHRLPRNRAVGRAALYAPLAAQRLFVSRVSVEEKRPRFLQPFSRRSTIPQRPFARVVEAGALYDESGVIFCEPGAYPRSGASYSSGCRDFGPDAVQLRSSSD